MRDSSLDREAVEAEIDRVRSLGFDELRALWRRTFRSSPPSAFTKDLVARFICWHLQEQALGGLDANSAKLLDGLASGDKGAADRPRRLKPGTVLVREYQGERHTVTVVADGFLWGDSTYRSLTTIARAIAGTAWSGPRFRRLSTAPRRPISRSPASPISSPAGGESKSAALVSSDRSRHTAGQTGHGRRSEASVDAATMSPWRKSREK
jgi:hypothetical protein